MNDNLPPLPEPIYKTHPLNRPDAYSEWQMLEYGQLCRQQALEEAAKLCDGYADNSSHPMNFSSNCAESIRSLK